MVTTSTITVEFEGPFSWIDGNGVPSLSQAKVGKKAGVYLWTIPLDEGELVYYVGQTGRSFAQRMLEHFREHMSGGYHLYEPQQFSHGRKIMLWPGRYGSTGEHSLTVFLQRFPQLAAAMADLAKMYRFFIAPLECNKRLRERIEAGIAKCLYAQPGIVGDFQDKGIYYRPKWDTEEPIQTIIHSTRTLIGVPESLWV